MITTIIRKLPVPLEFCLVLLICFWWAIYANILHIASYSRSTPKPAQQPYSGIGAVLGEKDNNIIIIHIMPNTPAAKAGLSYGLVIRKIDGIATTGRNVEDCIAMIHGPVGSQVKLELVDLTYNKTNTVELTRASIQDIGQQRYVTDTTALKMNLLELLGLAVTFCIARIRGWPLATWGFQPSWRLTGAGVLLCLFTLLVLAAIAWFSNIISPGIVHGHSISQLTLPFLVLYITVVAFFEETMELGYFVQSLQRYGMWGTILVSALFRAFLHAYQGASALLLIFPVGLIFGFVYWKWRRLWPLYIAHALIDLYGLHPR